MLRTLTDTRNDPTAALARLALGLVMFPHAAQKVFGWFGGYGLAGTMGFFTGTLHLPAILGYLAIAAELFGSLALILGLGGRLGAIAVAAVMVGAVATVHWSQGFFMNWGGQQPGEGWEYHVLAIALAGVVMVRGSGALSLDRVLSRGGEADVAAPSARTASLRAA